MSRSGYSYDCENLELYRASVARALEGKRGQAFLRKLVEALDAMPIKELSAGTFQRGLSPCALGAAACHLGVDVSDLEPVEYGPDHYGAVERDDVALRFNIAPSMAAEIMYENDECGNALELGSPGGTVPAHWRPETDEERWQRMRDWAQRHLAEAPKT